MLIWRNTAVGVASWPLGEGGPIYGGLWGIFLSLVESNSEDPLASHLACCDTDDPISSWLCIVMEKRAKKQLSQWWIQVHFRLYYRSLALFMVAGGETFYALWNLIPMTSSILFELVVT